MLSLEVVEVLYFKCNLVDNYYQEISEVLPIFTFNKCCGDLLNIQENNSVFLETYNPHFDDITTTTFTE